MQLAACTSCQLSLLLQLLTGTRCTCKLAIFSVIGDPDVLLRLEGGVEFPVHSDVLKVHSAVLRDVAKSTSRHLSIAESDTIARAMEVIPLGSGDVLLWDQCLTAMYCFADGFD